MIFHVREFHRNDDTPSAYCFQFFSHVEFISSHTRISCNQKKKKWKNAQIFFYCCYFFVNICLSCIRMHSTDFDWNWFSGFLVVRRAHHERWWQLWRFEYVYLNSGDIKKIAFPSSYRAQFNCNKRGRVKKFIAVKHEKKESLSHRSTYWQRLWPSSFMRLSLNYLF